MMHELDQAELAKERHRFRRANREALARLTARREALALSEALAEIGWQGTVDRDGFDLSHA